MDIKRDRSGNVQKDERGVPNTLSTASCVRCTSSTQRFGVDSTCKATMDNEEWGNVEKCH